MVPAFLAAALVTRLVVQDWSRADRESTRLLPSAFPILPAAVRADLERRGCTIPQPYGAKSPENVIAGAFTRKGDIDWAVLCSIRRISTILIYREGSVHNVDRLERFPDSTFLQVVAYDAGGNPMPGYSRAIGRADAKQSLITPRTSVAPTPRHSTTMGSKIPSWRRGLRSSTGIRAVG